MRLTWYTLNPPLVLLFQRYTNAGMKICKYRLYMKIICWRFHIKTAFSFWDIRTWYVCLETFRINRIYQKLAYLLRNLHTSWLNNSRILRVKNAKFLGYCFYMNTNIQWDFQICIIVPLTFIIFMCRTETN